jgi:alpha,alpha-trehalase
VENELVCEPIFDYGSMAAEWSLVGDDRHTADANGAGQSIRLSTDMALGVDGDRVGAGHTLLEASSCSARFRGSRASP